MSTFSIIGMVKVIDLSVVLKGFISKVCKSHDKY